MFVYDVSDFLFVGKVEPYFLSAGEEVLVLAMSQGFEHQKQPQYVIFEFWCSAILLTTFFLSFLCVALIPFF